MEFLFTAPEFPIKDIVNGYPVYKNTDNTDEQYRVEIYPYVSAGILRFVKDVVRIFGEADLCFSPLMVAYLIRILRFHPTNTDKKFMKDLFYASDPGHTKYVRMFRFW